MYCTLPLALVPRFVFSVLLLRISSSVNVIAFLSQFSIQRVGLVPEIAER